MAVFTSLFHVGDTIAQMIRDRLGLASDKVVVGPPRNEPVSTTDHVRVSLLWVNEQTTHRNDPSERGAGTEAPPPLTLSVTYLVTAYGHGTDETATGAHQILGEVLRIFHDEPVLRLPLVGLPASGEGRLGVTLMPITPEAFERIFSPLQAKHRPFVLYEVGPVQLKSLKTASSPKPVVAPGGLRLGGPTPRARPVLSRVVPHVVGVGGRIRLDGVFDKAPSRVWVGQTSFEGAELLVIDPYRSVSVALPSLGLHALPPGTHRASVVVDELVSEPLELVVTPAAQATLDGPTAIQQAKSADLSLVGRGLAGATAVIAWPEAGVRDPSEVETLAVHAAADAAVTVKAAELASLREGTYRFAVALGANRYTPFVVLEVVP